MKCSSRAHSVVGRHIKVWARVVYTMSLARQRAHNTQVLDSFYFSLDRMRTLSLTLTKEMTTLDQYRTHNHIVKCKDASKYTI